MKEVSGRTWLQANDDSVPVSLQGGRAVMADDNKDAWSLPTGRWQQHHAVSCIMLAGSALFPLPGTSIYGDGGNVPILMGMTDWLQVSCLRYTCLSAMFLLPGNFGPQVPHVMVKFTQH